MADAAVDPELADRAEDQVLRRQPGVKLALELDEHRLRSPLRQRLGREHVLDLRRADADGECPESAVRRGMRVAADDREARLREAELRADDVHDSLAAGAGRVQLDPELGAVRAQGLELRPGELVLDRPLGRGHVVIHRRHGALGSAHAATGQPQPLEGLRRGDLVDEMEVDVEQRRLPGRLDDHVIVPDLLEEGARAPLAGVGSRPAEPASAAA